MFKRDYETLTGVADKVEAFANKLDNSVDMFFGLLEGVGELTNKVVSNLHDNAQALREEAASKKSDSDTANFGWNSPPTVSREQKVDFIVSQLAQVGVTNSKWANPLLLSQIPDYVVDSTYAAFGGK